MATRGAKPKPAEVKRLLGNPGKRPLPDGRQITAVPAIDLDPQDLDPVGALERVLEDGVVWLASTDAPAVALLRDALDHLSELRANPMSRASDVVAVRKQVGDLLAQLGFDPTARARLGLAEVKAKSKLDELADRQAKRRGG